MTIGQVLSLALFLVWVCACVYWGTDSAILRYQRRVARRHARPFVVDAERSQQLHAIVKGTDRRIQAGYQQGRDWR